MIHCVLCTHVRLDFRDLLFLRLGQPHKNIYIFTEEEKYDQIQKRFSIISHHLVFSNSCIFLAFCFKMKIILCFSSRKIDDLSFVYHRLE